MRERRWRKCVTWRTSALPPGDEVVPEYADIETETETKSLFMNNVTARSISIDRLVRHQEKPVVLLTLQIVSGKGHGYWKVYLGYCTSSDWSSIAGYHGDGTRSSKSSCCSIIYTISQ